MVNEGDRVELLAKPDKYTKLEPGARGTVQNISTISEEVSGTPGGQKQYWVDWDSGGKLALLEGEDEFEVIEDDD